MSAALRRANRSLDEVRRLRARVETWRERRAAADPNNAHQTVLRLVTSEVDGSLARLEPEYEAIAPLQRGEAYERCRRLDAVLAFVWQLWEWYRVRLDQRDTSVRDLLFAADEVVHSCYTVAFPVKATRPAPEPLVYVEPTLTPDAQRWHVLPEGVEPPAGQTDVAQQILADRIQGLGVPTIRIPALTRDEPWILALLAHEVGHHVQQGLGGEVWGGFATAVADDVAATLGDSAARRWRGWGREIFADVFGVLAVGPWLTWAISELEWRADANMGVASTGYPPPPVRWSLMLSVLAEAGVPQAPPAVAEAVKAAQTLPDDVMLAVRADLAVVRQVAQLAVPGDVVALPVRAGVPNAAVPAFSSITRFARADHLPKGAVATWANRLRGGGVAVKSGGQADARMCAAAAACVWSELPDDATRDRREDLAGRILEQLRACHEPGTRAAGPATLRESSLADDLLALSADELGVAS